MGKGNVKVLDGSRISIEKLWAKIKMWRDESMVDNGGEQKGKLVFYVKRDV